MKRSKSEKTVAVNEKVLRRQIVELLSGRGAHADSQSAFAGIPVKLRGVRPEGLPHSLWELLEHMRIAQWDILEFSRSANHVSPDWPAGYWPKTPGPSGIKEWKKSLKYLEGDAAAMKKLVANPKTELTARIPHGDGQTVLREALLFADHNAYHLGQVILVRRLLGIWKDS